MCHAGNFCSLSFCQFHIGGNDTDGGISAAEGKRRCGFDDAFFCIGKGAVRIFGTGDDFSIFQYIPKSVHRNESRYSDTVFCGFCPRTDAAVAAVFHAIEFPDRCAAACAVIAFHEDFVGSGFAGSSAHGFIRAYKSIPITQVKKNSRGNDGNLCDTYVKADAFFFQIVHDTAGSFQTKSGTAGKDNSLYSFHGIDGVQ